MNWYKKSQIETDYFRELSEKDEYVPRVDTLKEKLEREYGISIVSKIDQGDSGQAYMLSDGDVLKITTNKKEGENALWLMNNPHPNVASYKDVWKDGNLYYIIMEHLDVHVPRMIEQIFSFIEKNMEKHHCYGVQCAIKIIQKVVEINERLKGNWIVESIMSYLKHIIGLKPFDFLNISNVGMKNGRIKFFDIT